MFDLKVMMIDLWLAHREPLSTWNRLLDYSLCHSRSTHSKESYNLMNPLVNCADDDFDEVQSHAILVTCCFVSYQTVIAKLELGDLLSSSD